MTEKQASKEIDKILKEQDEKGVLRWQIGVSLFSKGFSENQTGLIMGIHHKTAHACKIDFQHGKSRREIKSYLKMDIIRMQAFIKTCKVLVGEPRKCVK